MHTLISTLQVCSLFATGATAGTIAAVTLDGHTNVPIGGVLGAGATVFLVGMWVSRKLTHVDDKLDIIDTRLNKIDGRLDNLPCNQPNCPPTPAPGAVKRESRSH